MKIDFEFQTAYGVFRDALHLPDDHEFAEEQLQAMKEQRKNNWIQSIENPLRSQFENDIVVVDGTTYQKIEVDGQIVLKPLEI